MKVFCCCFEWPYPEEFLHNFKTKKKKCLAIACRKKNRLRFATHSQYIFLQPLPGLQIVGSSQKKKTSKAKIGSARSGKGLVRFSHHVLLHECTLLSLRAFEDFSFPFLTILTSFATGTTWFRRSSW